MRSLLLALLMLLAACGVEPATTPPSPERPRASATTPTPDWRSAVPEGTRQVVRTISSREHCPRRHCAVTQAWEERGGAWHLVRELPSTIGARGWGKVRAEDDRTPVGVFGIKVTFSATKRNPGRMPWRPRLPTSTVTDAEGPSYNTWLEEPDRTDGDRPSMRYGIVLDYNNVRLRPGAGPAPVPGKGSGIFFHTSRPGRPWEPSDGCVRVSKPRDMRWLLTWLRPEAEPRIVLNL